MATLILSTVGSLLGGPIGGAIGSLVGQGIDQQLFGGGPRQGPRLTDLAVQNSTYGSPIPRLYGRMRVAGSIVWATDLIESSEMVSGGKGQPGTMVYSYSVSFAVALSSRPVRAIHRIWADGKLLRGADGDFKVRTAFRLHRGDEGQGIDPLIASSEGLARTPAYRGLAMAVFEGLELAEYGNRIPFLTFEVEADPGEIAVGTILADSSGGTVAGAASQAIGGFACYASSIRASIAPLVDLTGAELFDDGDRLASPSGAVRTIALGQGGCSADGDTHARAERAQTAVQAMPRSATLRYHDPARDYQAGQARAAIEGGTVADVIELPAALSADTARGLNENRLARIWAERDRLTLRLPADFLDLRPGTRVRLDDGPGLWTVASVQIERFVVRAELISARTAAAPLEADPGTFVPPADLSAGTLEIALFDLPAIGEEPPDRAILRVAACTTGPRWRALPIALSAANSAAVTQTLFREARLGIVEGHLPGGSADLIDSASAMVVRLFDAEHWLESRDDEALVGGDNLAAAGDELIQFGRAIPLGDGRFRLSRLLRGRRGTEWARSLHQPGEPFAMMDPAAVLALPVPREAIGAALNVTATGVDPGAPASANRILTGESLRPPSPVALTARRTPSGGLDARWVRRSRQGWAWLDEMDAPLGETRELYRVELSGPGVRIEREVEIAAAQFLPGILPEQTLGAWTLTVRQVGDLAVSRPAQIHF